MKMLIVILFLLFSFPIYAKHTYSKDQSLLKGEPLKVPLEFQNGTATADDVSNWSFSLRGEEYDEQPISLQRFPLNEDINAEIVLVTLGVSQNSSYLIFMKGEMGYRYLGDIEFSSIRFIFYKESGRLYLATTTHVSSEETIISLHSIVNNKLDYLYYITVTRDNPRDLELFEMIFNQDIEEHKLKDGFRL